MCFSMPKVPDAPKPLPPPDPAPIPTPAETSPESAEENRRKRLSNLRNGLMSTYIQKGYSPKSNLNFLASNN